MYLLIFTFLLIFLLTPNQKQTRFDAADKGEDFDKAVKEIKKDKEEKLMDENKRKKIEAKLFQLFTQIERRYKQMRVCTRLVIVLKEFEYFLHFRC